MNHPSRTSWWDLASAGTITCTSLTAFSFLGHGAAVQALPIYSGAGAVNVDGVVPGSNASVRVTADRGLVRWQQFSVQAGERFRIEGTPNQAILNVVTGPEASSIGGVVESGPRFLLANPNGIEVLGTGQIIAPSTWLTTGSVRDDDWLQHRPVTPGADVTDPHVQLDRQSAINLAGVVDADDGGHGGEVTLLAHDIHLASTTLVTADGVNGGGRIRIGGQPHGFGSDAQATQVTVAEGARLQANATKVGDGGEVVIWAKERTHFAGQIQAQGGPEGGDGGFVEVSARQALDFQGLVNTLAPQGRVGMLLLDPTDLTINNTADINITTTAGVSILPLSSPSVLTWKTIQKNLTSSALLIQTTGSSASGSEKGTITIAEASPDLDLTNRSLTFQAADDIKINASIYSTATTGALEFQAGTTGSGNSVSIANGKQIVANQVTMTADAIVFNGGPADQVVTTGNQGEQRYNGFVRLTGDTGLSGNKVSFTNFITGPHRLSLDFTGVTDLVPGVNGLKSLTLGSSGAATLLSGTLNTLGFQMYGSPVLLKGNTTITTAGTGTDGTIRFADKVDGAYGLDIKTTAAPMGGPVFFDAPVGSSAPLTTMTVRSDAVTVSDATTQREQSYLATNLIQTAGSLTAVTPGKSITLAAKTISLYGNTLIQTNAGLVELKAPVDGASAVGSHLKISTVAAVPDSGAADIRLMSSIGAVNRIGDLELNSDSNILIAEGVYANSLLTGTGGSTTITGGEVNTTASQSFGNALFLGAPTILRSIGEGGRIEIHDVDPTATSPDAALTLENLRGDVIFSGNLGMVRRLGPIQVNAGGTTRFGDPSGYSSQTVNAVSLTTDQLGDLTFDLRGGEIVTSGSQVYNDLGGVFLSSDLRFRTYGDTKSALMIAGAVEADSMAYSAPNIMIDVSGTAIFNGSIGALNPLGSITIDNSFGTRFAGSLAADALVFQPTAVIPSTPGCNYLEFLGDLNLASGLEFNPVDGYKSARDIALLGGNNYIGFSRGMTIFENTGSLVIGGLHDGKDAPVKAVTIFDGGLMVLGTQEKTTLVGTIQAGSQADRVINFLNANPPLTVGTGIYQLDHNPNTGDPVVLRGRVVKLSGTVDSSAGQSVGLIVDTAGDGANGHVYLNAEMGVTQPLDFFSTSNSVGSLAIDTSSIITKLGQSYAEAKVELFGHGLSASSLNAGTIDFAGKVDVSSNQTPVGLHVITDGIARFSGSIGSVNPLADLSTVSLTLTSGTTEFNGDLVKTHGNLTFGKSVFLGGAKAFTFDSPLLLVADTTLTSTVSSDIILNGTINSAPASFYDLTINTSGQTTLAGDIGKINALNHLVTDAEGSLTITAPTIRTSGSQMWNDSLLTLGAQAGDVIRLTSTNGGDISVGAHHVEGPGALQIDTSGDLSIIGVMGGGIPLSSLSIAARSIDLHDVTTTNSQSYSATDKIRTHSTYATTESAQPITFNGSLVLSEPITVITDRGAVTFTGDVDSAAMTASDLSVNTSSTLPLTGGDISFFGHVGAVTALGDVTLVGSGINRINGSFSALSLASDTTGTTQLVGGSVITSQGQTYGGPVELKADTTLASTSNGAIRFNGNLISPTTAYGLTISTSGSTIFNGRVGQDQLGNSHPLRSIETDSGGSIAFNGGVIETIGDQFYGEQALLGADLLLQSLENGAISLASTVDAVDSGSSSLVIKTGGLTTLAGRVGTVSHPLTSVITDQPGSIWLSGGSITTFGDQIYNDLSGLRLGVDTLLESLGTQNQVPYGIWFGGPVDGVAYGQQALTIDTQGLTHFNAPVGSIIPLRSLVTDGGFSGFDRVEIRGGTVITSDFQSYGEKVLIEAGISGGNTRFSAGGPISFGGSVDLDPLSQPGHLTIESPGSSVTFDQDVGLQNPFLTVTVLTGDLNLKTSTITTNGWDAINPNVFDSRATRATIALQGSRSVNSSLSGGLQGGSVLRLQNSTFNNSRWSVWSYAPLANVQATPIDSLPDRYGVQYLTPYNQTMPSSLVGNGNQFLYLVDPPSPPLPPVPPEPVVRPFDHLLNALQPPLNLRLPEPEAPVESIGDYVQLSVDRRPVSWGLPGSVHGVSMDTLAFSGLRSGDVGAGRLPMFPLNEVTADTTLGFAGLFQAEARMPDRDVLPQHTAQQVDASQELLNPVAEVEDYTPASVEFPSFPLDSGGGSLPRSLHSSASMIPAEVEVYPIPLSRLVGFPTSPVRLDDLQISGYQFRSQSYVALPRDHRGYYSPPQGMRLKAIQERLNVARSLGPAQGLVALEVLLDHQALGGSQLSVGLDSVLERVTIAVPTVFGTVIHVDVPTADLLRRTPGDQAQAPSRLSSGSRRS